MRKVALLLGLAVFGLAAPVHAQNSWFNVAMISATMGVQANRLCIGEASRGDIGCPAYAPSVDSAGLLTTGNISSTGNISANRFIGDGSGLTGVVASTADRIVSGTTSLLAVSNTGYISLTQAGVNTGWFDPSRGLVSLGLSTTGVISGSGIYAGPYVQVISDTALCASSTAGRVTYSSGNLLYCNGSAWTALAAGGSGTIDALIDGKTTASGASTFLGDQAGENTQSTEAGSVGVGQYALNSQQSGNFFNTALGYEAARYVSGTGGGDESVFNTAVGYQALRGSPSSVLSTGGANTAVGYQALKQNTSGGYNAALGVGALGENTTGGQNTALNGALGSNTTGSGNLGLGFAALSGNITGSYNIAAGSAAMAGNGTGGYNVALGTNALWLHASTNQQIAIGSYAMYYMSGTTANPAAYNVALGYGALNGGGNVLTSANNTGDSNHALGYQAGYSMTSGSSNTMVGMQSGYNISSGGQNTLLGQGTAATLTTGSRNIILGAGANVPSSGINDFINIGNAISGSIATGGSLTITGGLRAQGIVTATFFEGDGSRLTNLTLPATATDRISTSGVVSGANLGAVVASIGTVSFTLGGTEGAAYLHPSLGLVASGVSTTGVISGSGIYAGPYVQVISDTALCASSTAGRVTYSSGNLLYCNGSAWTALAAGGSGTIDALIDGKTTGTGGSTFLGDQAGSSTLVTEVGSVALGQNALASQQGGILLNTAVGYQAGRYISGTTANKAIYNVAFGPSALRGTTTATNNTGDRNTAVGAEALYQNASGDYNVALGSTALYANSSGSHNISIGYNTLSVNTTGLANTAIGTSSLSSNVGGNYNVALGYNALTFQSTGSFQTAVGANAMYYMSGTTVDPAEFNTALGYESLKGFASPASNTGNSNVALGYQAGLLMSSGSSNTMVGMQSGISLYSGDQNTLLGERTATTLQTGSRNIIIGAGANVPAAATSDFINIGNAISGSIATGGSLTLTGGLLAQGIVTATFFEGDGSRLTNLTLPATATDRISTSGVASGANLGMVVASIGTVSFTLGGVEGAAYLHPSLGLVASGVSTTGTISATAGYFRTNVGIGTATPTASLTVVGRVSASVLQLATDTGGCATGTVGTLRRDPATGKLQVCRE